MKSLQGNPPLTQITEVVGDLVWHSATVALTGCPSDWSQFWEDDFSDKIEVGPSTFTLVKAGQSSAVVKSDSKYFSSFGI